MAEDTNAAGKAAVRRGLPRRTGEAGQETARLASSASIAQAPASAGAAGGGEQPSAKSRRTGLPRPEGTQPAAAAAPSEPGAAPGPPPAAAPQSGGSEAASTAVGQDARRPPRSKVRLALLGLAGLLAAAALAVLAARWLVSLDFVQHFLARYPGETHLPEGAPIGLPAWLGWQHFLNAFFLVLIIRTGWQVRTQKRPPATWVRSNSGLLKTKNAPQKISLTLWAHLTFDALWILNGLLFVILLFATGQWMRVVPTSWDVFPNAVSAALQYLSLDWPLENGWVNYNSLQVLAYFVTIFIAAPLAALTGIRMSGAWPKNAARLNRIYPVEWARAIHFPVMLYFVLFVITHVALVFATGALRNLNHMYAAQDSGSWTGFWIFFASLAVMVGAVTAARPLVLAPIAQLTGKVGR